MACTPCKHLKKEGFGCGSCDKQYVALSVKQARKLDRLFKEIDDSVLFVHSGIDVEAVRKIEKIISKQLSYIDGER